MTKPTGVREIIEGIEKEFGDDSGETYLRVVAIALELERQRDLLLLGKPRAAKETWNQVIESIAKGEA